MEKVGTELCAQKLRPQVDTPSRMELQTLPYPFLIDFS